jgi:Pentapeptide repeats (8 copies)
MLQVKIPSFRAKSVHPSVNLPREAALQAYIDKMSELLLKEHLGCELTSKGKLTPEEEEARKIARVRTLTVLPRLDANRKRSVLQFLYESHLIDKDKRIIDLHGADLSVAYLFAANLSGADLSEAELNGANLITSHLSGVKVTEEQLKQAKSLEGATMPDGVVRP